MTPEENESITRRLHAGGIDIPINEDESCSDQYSRSGLLIDLVPEIESNCAVDLGEWGTFFILYVRITSNLPAFAPSRFILGLPWEDTQTYWLKDPLTNSWPPRPVYSFYAAPTLRYKRDDVLNHRTDVRKVLRRGYSMQGYLLGAGGPMPDDMQHGTKIPTMFSVVDQFGRPYPKPIPLWLDRTKRLLRETPKMTPRRVLFDVRDLDHASVKA